MGSPLERLRRALQTQSLRAATDLSKVVGALAAARAERLRGGSRTLDLDGALLRVQAALSRLSAAADLSGRLEVRFGVPAPPPEEFADAPDVVPVVAFEEAVRDLLERDPIGAADLRRAGLEVEDAYGSELDPNTGRSFYPHAFSAARALDEEVARRLRDRLASGLSAGTPTEEVAQELAEEWDWPTSYARTVARTTFVTATTAGRFRESERVQAAGIPAGFRFRTAGDSQVRPGHAALDGLTARADDPLWRRFSPPGGPNCRCELEPVVGDDVPVGFVSVPAGAEFSPGYGGRPDLSAYR